jgi:hypothetical protein
MQPRSDLRPLLSTLFHVTNKGYSSASESVAVALLLPRTNRLGSENSDVRDDAFEVVELKDGVLDAADGLEDEEEDEGGLSNLLIAAGL